MYTPSFFNRLLFFALLLTGGLTACNDDEATAPIAESDLTVTRVDPPIARPNDTITITGTGFNPEAARNVVQFTQTGDALSTVVSATATQLQVRVPGGARPGPVRVAVGPYLTVSPNDFLLVPLISGISPAQPSAGDPITIRGDYFSEFRNRVVVRFTLGDYEFVQDSITAASNALVISVLPGDIPFGTVQVQLGIRVGDDSVAYSSAFPLLVPNPDIPNLGEITPDEGLPGAWVTLSGLRFGNDTAKVVVTFGELPVRVTSVRNDQITVELPGDEARYSFGEDFTQELTVSVGVITRLPGKTEDDTLRATETRTFTVQQPSNELEVFYVGAKAGEGDERGNYPYAMFRASTLRSGTVNTSELFDAVAYTGITVAREAGVGYLYHGSQRLNLDTDKETSLPGRGPTNDIAYANGSVYFWSRLDDQSEFFRKDVLNPSGDQVLIDNIGFSFFIPFNVKLAKERVYYAERRVIQAVDPSSKQVTTLYPDNTNYYALAISETNLYFATTVKTTDITPDMPSTLYQGTTAGAAEEELLTTEDPIADLEVYDGYLYWMIHAGDDPATPDVVETGGIWRAEIQDDGSLGTPEIYLDGITLGTYFAILPPE